MSLHLAEISLAIEPGAHGVLLMDQAGWHMTGKLEVPDNISIVPLPPKCPELNPVENIWQFMRDNWLSNRIFTSHDNIVDLCCEAWNRLIDQPCWGGRPPYGIRMCQSESLDLNRRRPPMEQIIRIGMDTSKHLFQLHGVNAAEQPILRKKLRRKEMIDFFQKLPSTVVAIEACGASHHWARLLGSFGHEVKLIAPQLAKPYVKRGKNDAADAEALCEAMSRPTMRFVPVKTAEQQAALMLVGMRDRLVRSRTQLTNAIRGYAAEFGLTTAKGIYKIEPLLERTATDETVPTLARELFALHASEYQQLERQLEDVEAKLLAWHRKNECSRRLAQIPGVGPIGASLLMMKTPAPELFASGRQFAAWLGLTPKDHSTAGKARQGVITRAGDEALRSILVVGATSLLRRVRDGSGKNATPWLLSMLKRKPPKLVAVALANKIARIAWKMMATGETYRKGVVLSELKCTA